MDPQMGYLIPPFTDFGCRTTSRFTKVFAHFFMPEITLAPGVYPIPLSKEQWASLHPLAQELDRYSAIPWFATVICNVLSRLDSAAFAGHHIDARIQRAIDLMHSRLGSPPSNSELARVTHLSTGAFPREFRNAMGTSPQSYLMRLRLQHACERLLYSSDTIEKVSEQCGFHDRFHFSHAFKRQWQISPGRYRVSALNG